jgi:hypothetical protein
MASFQDVAKKNESIVLDGNEFIDCKFQGCELIYRGGELPKLQRCDFTQCSWKLDGAAKQTILFLRSIYHSGPGGKDLVEGTLRHIRTK